jgi:Mce-associated membrane protein
VEVAVPPAPDDRPGLTKDSSDHDDQHGPVPAAAFRVVLLIVLSLLLVLSAGTFVALAVTGESSPTAIFDDADAKAEVDRQKVIAQAQQFILRVNTYGPDLLAEDGTMPDYREQVREVITDKFAESFEESVPAAESTVAQAGFSRRAEVFGAGVSVIDGDSATALVAGAFTNSYPDPDDDTKRVDDVPLPFRVEVKLVKVDGKWLVDAFTPVTGEAEGSSGTPSGSPSPSEEASP